MSAINGTTLHWVNVTRATPCPVCDKLDWCSLSQDGDWCRCNRLAEHPSFGKGKEKQDAAGVTYWVYRLTPWPERSGAWPEPRFGLASGGGKRADADTLHRVYGKLLEQLTLLPRHADDLRRRGLKKDLWEKGYRSLGAKGRGAAVQHLIKAGLEHLLPQVPGFFVQEHRGRKYWTVSGPRGLLIPMRDQQKRIVALLVRVDEASVGGKYRYLSNRKRGGAGPGSPVHIPLFDGDRSVVRVTEGALKADVATELSQVLTIGLPGVSSWRRAGETLRQLETTTVRVAFDADARRNRLVADALRRLVENLQTTELNVELEVWEETDVQGD